MSLSRLHLNLVLAAVEAERYRQEMLCYEGKFPFTLAAMCRMPHEKLPALAEEFGEVARHVTEYVISANRLDEKKLREELIQLAATAVAWAESLTNAE